MKLVAYVSTADSLDLLHHWFGYYRGLGVEEFHLFFSNPLGDECAARDLLKVLQQNRAIVIDQSTGTVNEAERVIKISDYKATALSGESLVFTVDSDEFVGINSQRIKALLDGEIDYVNGTLIDRFAPGGRLAPVTLEGSVFSQFPVQALFSADVLKARSTKVPLSRPWVRLGPGLHRVEPEGEPKSDGIPVPVYHFKWTRGLAERLQARLDSGFSCEQYQIEARYLLEECMELKSRIKIEMTLSWVDRADQEGI